MFDVLAHEFADAGNERFASRPRVLWIWRAAGLAALVPLATALYWTIRLSRADWLFLNGNPQSIQQAIRLAPGAPDYYSGWAQAEPDRAVDVLEKAVALNPINSSLRIELGLAAEEKGDFRKAEASLLEAMRLDTSFAPRWALSDFYLHRRDAEKFWPVVKAALTISYGDVSAQFRNCWSLSQDAPTILERAIPDRQKVLREYLEFLIREKRMEAAARVAELVLARAGAEDTATLLNYGDYLLEAGQSRPALAVWNELNERKLLPYAPLAPEMGRSLTNGDFATPNVNAGFDWRFTPPEGIYLERVGNPPAVFVSFTGQQPEDCEILSQYVPVLPKREYVLSVRYRATGIPAESGPLCRVLRGNGGDLLHEGGLLPGGSEGDTDRAFRFATPADTTLVLLVFGYKRMRGTVRIEGSVILREFKLTLEPEGGR
jgi:tetratricopeptide (TPR) repeat protein